MRHEPRPHQAFGVSESIRLIDSGVRSFCLTSPTGGGKSMIVELLLEEFVSRGWQCAVFTNRKLLTSQLSRGLNEAGIHLGIRAATFESWTDPNAPVQVCSMQTELHRVLKKRERAIARLKTESEAHAAHSLFPAQVVFVDEIHMAAGSVMEAILAEYREKYDAVVIGVTATPLGVSHLCDELLVAGNNSQLRACGALVPAYCYEPASFDIWKVRRTKTGIMSQTELDEKVKAIWSQHVVGKVFESWKELNPDGKASLGFAPGVAESLGLATDFHRRGINAAHIASDGIYVDGQFYNTTEQADRDDIFARSKAGEVPIIFNRFVLREAIDLPWVECLTLATPIASLVSYIQTVGRVLRASPSTGKTRCIAEGSLVLTDHGLVAIEEVEYHHRLWDGRSWVSHGGVVCNGTQKVVSYSGLTATPDHRVWTEGGWRSLIDCKRLRLPIAKTGSGRQGIRVGHCYISRDESEAADRSQEGIRPCSMSRLRGRLVGSVGQSVSRKNARLSEMSSTEKVSEMALVATERSEPEVQQPKQCELASVWREGNPVLVPFNSISLSVGYGKSRNRARGICAAGSYRQRRKLRTGQSKVVNSSSKHGSHSHEEQRGFSSQVSHATSKHSIRRCNTQENVFNRDDTGTDHREMAHAFDETERRVWDILEAGPFHCFTVSGVLAHNCTVIDHGGAVRMHGSPNLDRDEDWRAYFHKDADKITADRLDKLRDPECQEPEPITCPACGMIRKTGPKCPGCGHQHTKSTRQVIQEDGRLNPVEGDVFPKRHVKMKADTAKLWEQCYFRGKNARKPMSFKQIRGLFKYENHYWPPMDLPLMPKSKLDWSRKVKDVHAADLIPKGDFR